MVKTTRTTRKDIFNRVLKILELLKSRVVNDEAEFIIEEDMILNEPVVYINAELDFIYRYQHRFTKNDMLLIQDIVTLLNKV